MVTSNTELTYVGTHLVSPVSEVIFILDWVKNCLHADLILGGFVNNRIFRVKLYEIMEINYYYFYTVQNEIVTSRVTYISAFQWA